MEHAPLVYQQIGATRRELRGGWVMRGRSEVGFGLAKYDRTGILVIDPVLSYSTFLGGTLPKSNEESGNGIAVNASGNAYVTGETASTNFPATAGASQTALAGEQNAFITKLNPSGSALVYSTYLGGNSTDGGLGIAVNASGDAYVAGETASTNFPTTAGAFQTTPAGKQNAFITELNPSGSALVYSTYLGGTV